MEVEACNFVEREIFGGIAEAFDARQIIKHLLFGRRQHAIQAAEDGHGQDDLSVVAAFVITPQQVRNFPDQVGFFFKIEHRNFGK